MTKKEVVFEKKCVILEAQTVNEKRKNKNNKNQGE